MKQKFKQLIPYFLVVLVIVLPWFFEPGYVFFTDFAWGPKILVDWHGASFLFNVVIAGLSHILSTALLQKIFISSIFLIVLLSGKKLIKEIFLLFGEEGNNKSDYWLVFILSLFFLFNPFIYDRVMYGQFGIVMAFSFLSLALGYLLAYFRSKKIKEMAYFGIFAGLMLLFSIHFIFFLAPLAILFFLRAVLKKEVNWHSFFCGLALALIILLAINLNWLINVVKSGSQLVNFINQGITTQDLIAFQTAGETNKEVVSNVLMMSGFWGKDQFRYDDLTKFKENWGKSFFLLLPIILLGVWVSLRNKKTRFLSVGLLILFVLSVVLAIGIRLPIAKEISQFLYNRLPFYKGLREPQKWVSVVVIIYLIYLGLGAKYLSVKKVIKNNSLISGLVLAGIIVMQAPLLLFGLNGQVGPVEYPKDWQEVDNYIVENYKLQNPNSLIKCGDNILFLPWHLYMSFDWIGRIVLNPANKFFSCPVISSTAMEWGGIYDNSMNPRGKLVADWLREKSSPSFLGGNNELNIRYIILAKEVDWQNYFWIESFPELKMIKETQTLKLYRIDE